MTDVLQSAFLDRLEPEIAQLEANVALWRLEAGHRSYRLSEDRAVGADVSHATMEAQIAMEGIAFEIDRLQAWVKNHTGLPEAAVLRINEIGVELHTARRKLTRALVFDASHHRH